MTNPWLSQPNVDPFEERNMTDRCGYTVTDSDGVEEPCDRLAEHWRWYQDVVEHEDCLDVACDWHANEGGRRMHAAEAERDRLKATVTAVRFIWESDLDHQGCCESLTTGRGRDCNCWRTTVGAVLDPADAPQGAPGTSGSPDPVPGSTSGSVRAADRLRALAAGEMAAAQNGTRTERTVARATARAYRLAAEIIEEEN